MAIRNQSLTVNFQAWNTSTNQGETGDSANFTLRLIKDGGVPAAPGGAITEPDSTNLLGIYEIVLTDTEMDADFVTLGGISSTANVEIIPLLIHTESGDFAAIKTETDKISAVDAGAGVAGSVIEEVENIIALLPTALVGGRMDSSVGAMAANVLTAAAINAAAITSAKFGAGAIDANAIATDAIGSAELATTAVNEIRDAILDELTANHVGVGSVGEVLDNLPNDGALTNLDAAITTRATPAQVLTNAIQALRDIGLVLTTATIETVTSQTLLIIPATADAPDNDVYNDCIAIIIDGTDPNQRSVRRVDDYDAGTRTVTISSAPEFTVDTADTIVILATSISKFILTDRTPFPGASITEVRLVELDAANIPTDLSNIQSDTDDIQTRLPTLLVGGRMDSSVGAMAANVITAVAIATGAIDADSIAADAIDLIWDEPLAGHTTLATFGQVINALGARTGAVNDAGALAADFDVDGFTEASNGHFNSHTMVFTTGNLIGQSRIITAYTGAGQNCAFDRPWTEAPANNDEFVILGPIAGALDTWLATAADVEANSTILDSRAAWWAMAKLINRVAIAAGTLTVYEDDDTTAIFTQVVTGSAGADPVVEVDTV